MRVCPGTLKGGGGLRTEVAQQGIIVSLFINYLFYQHDQSVGVHRKTKKELGVLGMGTARKRGNLMSWPN